jgi:protein-tyrosine-phosphatase
MGVVRLHPQLGPQPDGGSVAAPRRRSRFIVASAGTDPTRLHPTAEQVMAERGIALDSHRAKSLAEVGIDWSYAITVCDAAFERCADFSSLGGVRLGQPMGLWR